MVGTGTFWIIFKSQKGDRADKKFDLKSKNCA